MGLSQHIALGQQQKLTMTPRLRQAIQVLQMNQADLFKHLESEVMKNPLLEIDTSRIGDRTAPVQMPRSDSDYNAIDHVSAVTSQIDLLSDQVGLMQAPPARINLAKMLIGELSETGYLRTPLFELADRLNVSIAELEPALDLVQACEPVGTGARDLRECLMLQLKARNRYDPVMQTVLDHLDLVAADDLAKLAALTGETEPAMADILAEIRLLNPRPAAGLTAQPIGEIVPDVELKPGEMGEWRIELVPEALPRVLINNTYAAELSAKGGEEARFADTCLTAANWLIQALDQRAKTILKAATAIVKHQYAFFSDGPIAMRPLTLRDIAESIDMHESTVSRVTSGKFLTCPSGTFELKYFFSGKIPGIAGGTVFSALAIRTRIKRLIAQESQQNMLSDDAIVKILREDGADVARRTIAKYRESMGIPSSVRRRRLRDTAMRISDG